MNVLDEPLLDDAQAAAILGVAPKTLPQWRHKRKGPPYVMVGDKYIRYTPSILRKYLAERLVDPATRKPVTA
jgi:hypothetical protein